MELDGLKAAGLERAGVRLEVGGHGKVQYALRVQQFIMESKQKIDLVVCAGACGSLLSQIKPLDVVIAENTVEHDFRLRFVKRPLPNFNGHAGALSKLKNFKASGFGVHFGPMASGDEDVMDSERAGSIQKATGALGVAWEGAGGARACMLAGVPFIEIRGVTDSCSGPVPEHFEKNLKPAMKNIATVISALI